MANYERRDNVAIVHIDVPNGSGIITQLKDTEYYSWNKEVSYSRGRSEFDNKILTLGTNLSVHGGDYTYNFGNVDIIWNQTGDGGDTSADIRIYFAVKNHSTGQLVANLEHNWHVGGNRSVLENYIEFAVDHSNQKGYVVRPNISLMNWSNKYGMEVALEDGGLELYKLLYPTYTSNGGGATHIAKVTGQLKDLSSNLSDILIVSGGGGGGLLVGEDTYAGKEAGGISGSGDNSADQSTGNAFGQGESGTNLSGGGSGLYGGYKGTSSKSGGAGSGYIGNSLLSNKKMVGYNVPTSSTEGTKTESVSIFDSNYVANKPKAGNGHCRIKLVAEPMPTKNLEYFRKNAGRFDNYVSFNIENVIKSNDARPYLLGDKDIVGYPSGGSWSYNYDSTSDTYTISTGSQVDYNFAVNRIQNPYKVIIECDAEPSSGRQAWISLVATYVNNDGNAVEVVASEGDNFVWVSESIHMRLVYNNDVLPYIDYIRFATGNGPWSNLRISNFKITLFQ